MKKMLVLLFLITFTNVVRAYDALIDGVYYNLYQSSSIAVVTNEKDYVINGSDIYSGTIEIPETIQFNGKMYKVTEIGKYAFFGSKISSVSLPNSITTIGDRAFFGCEYLRSVKIPASVINIGIYAFAECDKILEIYIPENVKSIGEGAFNSSCLKSIKVDERNAQYDSREDCNAIIETHTNTIIAGCKNSIIPNTIEVIGMQSFAGCKELTSIQLPQSISDIGECAFAESGLSNIIIPNSVNFIGTGAFQNTNLKTVTIPKSVITIENVAFSGNDSLTTIYLEDGVGLICSNAFASCENLKDVYCYSEDVPSTKGDGIFGGYYQNAILHVPQKAIDNYKNNAVWSRQFKKIVSIEDNGKANNLLWIPVFVVAVFIFFWIFRKTRLNK